MAQMLNSVALSILTLLCRNHHYPFPVPFPHPPEKLCTPKIVTPTLPRPSALGTPILLCLYESDYSGHLIATHFVSSNLSENQISYCSQNESDYSGHLIATHFVSSNLSGSQMVLSNPMVHEAAVREPYTLTTAGKVP